MRAFLLTLLLAAATLARAQQFAPPQVDLAPAQAAPVQPTRPVDQLAPPGADLPTVPTPEGAPKSRPDPTLDLAPPLPGQLLPMPGEVGVLPDADVPPAPRRPPAKVTKREKSNRTEEVEAEFAARVRFRQVETRALLEPKLQAQWNDYLRAPTDQLKRELLRTYYRDFYARIRKLDSSTKKEADERERLAVARLAQKRFKGVAGEDEESAPDVRNRTDRGIITNDNL